MDLAEMIDALRNVPISSQIYSQEARHIIGAITADASVAFVGETYMDTHSYVCAIRYGSQTTELASPRRTEHSPVELASPRRTAQSAVELWRYSHASDNGYRYMGPQSADITYSVVSDLYKKIKPTNPTTIMYLNRIHKYSKELDTIESDIRKVEALAAALQEKRAVKAGLLRNTRALMAQGV